MGYRTRRSWRPEYVYGGLGLVLSLLAAGGLWLALKPVATVAHLLAAWLAGVNATTFGYYGYDKGRAQANGRRVPEVVLHGLALAGGSPGAYLGMRLFRHKTIKGPFRFVFWAIVVLQLALIAALAYRLWHHAE